MLTNPVSFFQYYDDDDFDLRRREHKFRIAKSAEVESAHEQPPLRQLYMPVTQNPLLPQRYDVANRWIEENVVESML